MLVLSFKKFVGLLIVTISICGVQPVVGQNCTLYVTVAEGSLTWDEHKKSKYDVITAKSALSDFSVIATDQKTNRVRKGVYLHGAVYFENLLAGNYTLTITKPGFVTEVVKNYTFSCDSSDGMLGFNTMLLRGSSTESRIKDHSDDFRFTLKGDRYFSPTQIPSTISGGELTGKATNLSRPAYPESARAVNARGDVQVQILVDETGSVVSAAAISGHPLLRQAAVSEARKAKFKPVELSGVLVKVSGYITFTFKTGNPVTLKELNGFLSTDANLSPFRNTYLIKAVELDGIDFILTKEIELKLKLAGADDKLIATIHQIQQYQNK